MALRRRKKPDAGGVGGDVVDDRPRSAAPSQVAAGQVVAAAVERKQHVVAA